MQAHPTTSHATDKRAILRQEPSPGPTLESRKRPRPPLLLCQSSPLPWYPVPHYPVVPCCQSYPSPRRSSSVPMDITSPAQHGSLTSRQQPIPEPPCMHPELLPVEVLNLEHAKLGKEGVCMLQPPPQGHQPSKPLLVPEEGPC